MHFTKLLGIASLVLSVNAGTCTSQAASCTQLAVTASSSCSSLLARSGVKSSSCSTVVTPLPATTTVTKATTSTIGGGVTVTSTRTIQQTFHQSTQTVTPTVIVTSTSTSYITSSTTLSSTVSTTSTIVAQATTTLIKRYLGARAAAIPSDCSCFLTSTVTSTGKTPIVTATSFITITTTNGKTVTAHTTVTSMYFGVTQTVAPVTSTSTVVSTSTVTSSTTVTTTSSFTTTSTAFMTTTYTQITATTTESGTSEFTSTVSGIVIIGVSTITQTTNFITTSLAPGAPGFTSTIPQVGTTPGQVIIGVSAPPLSTTTITSGTVLTTITSGTIVEILKPTPDLSCGNQGLAFAFYDNPYYNGDDTYSNFDPTYFKNANPKYGGVTTTLGFTSPGGEGSIYNSPPVDESYLTINHRGYVFAQETGLYTFSTPRSDDITIVWIGSIAYSGWNRQNANIVQPYVSDSNGGATPVSYSVLLTQGQYYALRIVFGNAQENAAFALTITAPDGSLIIGEDTTASPYLVQYSCDLTSAPIYPAFGQET